MTIEYLNTGFLGKTWPFAAELLGSEIVHGAWTDAQKQGLHLHVSETGIDLSAPPRFSSAGPNLKLQFPASSSYKFSTYVEKHSPWPLPDIGADVAVNLRATFTIGADAPQVDVYVDAEGDVLGDILDWFADWEQQVEKQVRDGFGTHLGFFNSVRYVTMAGLTVPEPRLAFGLPRLDPTHAIDVLLVSDGFTSVEMGDFKDFVDAFVKALVTFASSRVNEPFFSFRTSFRIWTLQVPAVNASDVRERVVAGYYDPQTNSKKSALGNLARMGAIGAKAQEIGADVVVFVANRSSLEQSEVRALALGATVLLPVSKSTAGHDATVLLHELGHTVLGGLADEYVEGTQVDMTYHGKEPGVPNVTSQASNAAGTAPQKWSAWRKNPQLRPSWDPHVIAAHEGARYYGKGLWRPSTDCKMNHADADIPFCAVCREAITRRIRQMLGEDAFLMSYEYPSLTKTHTVSLGNPKAGKMVTRVRVPETGAVDLHFQLLAGTLPEPWNISASLIGNGPLVVSDRAWRFGARLGDVLQLNVATSCPYTPWDTLPAYMLEVRCDLPLRDIAAASPTVPTDLNAKLIQVTEHSKRLRLSATASDPNADDLRLEFEVASALQEFTGLSPSKTDWLSWTVNSPIVRGTVDVSLSGGNYRFRVRAADITGLKSAWSEPKAFKVPGEIID